MKKLFFAIAAIFLCLTVNAQSAQSAQSPYYFYIGGGKKVDLSLNTRYAFLSVREPKLPEGLAQRGVSATEFQSERSSQRQFVPRFYTRLIFEEQMSDEQYLRMLSDLKRDNREIIIHPYFKSQTDEIIGLSKRL